MILNDKNKKSLFSSNSIKQKPSSHKEVKGSLHIEQIKQNKSNNTNN